MMLEFGPGGGPAGPAMDPGSMGSAGGGGWEESLDLDWMTDHEVRYLLPPTQRTRYQTKVFQQSVTLLIKLQPNDTNGGGATRIQERGVGVGPWRVPEDQLPALVGVITGASILLLLLLSLLLYTVCHTTHHLTPKHKKYSVKSEVSSVTSGRSQGSVPSLSRESLLVITHAASGHQACLLPDRSSPADFIFECGCCCDPPCQLPCTTCDCPGGAHNHEDEDDDDDDDEEGSDEMTVYGEGEGSLNGSIPRSLSLPIRDKTIKTGQNNNINNNNNTSNSIGRRSSMRSSVRSKSSGRSSTAAAKTVAPTPVAFIHCDFTLPRVKRGEGQRRSVDFTVCNEGRLEEQSVSSSAIDMLGVMRGGGGYLEEGRGGVDGGGGVIDESYKTRSLPAWVRNKSRPPLGVGVLDDLNTIYEKPQWSKRRRNRMRSDAATVIALSKSRARLMSTGAASTSGRVQTPTGPRDSPQPAGGQGEAEAGAAGSAPAGGGGSAVAPSVAAQPDTVALVENEAVIVYDERTAL